MMIAEVSDSESKDGLMQHGLLEAQRRSPYCSPGSDSGWRKSRNRKVLKQLLRVGALNPVPTLALSFVPVS